MPTNSAKSIDGLKRPAKKPATPKAGADIQPATKTVAKAPKRAAKAAKPAASKPIAVGITEEPIVKTTAEEPDDIMQEINRLEESEPDAADQENVPELTAEKKALKAPKKRTLASKIIAGILLVGYAASAAVFIYHLLRLNVLADWMTYAAIAAIILIFLFLLRKLTKRKARGATRIICGVLAFILIAGYCWGTYYVASTVGFLENITADNTEKVNYTLAILKTNAAKDVKALDGRKIAFTSNNLHLAETKAKLKETISFEDKDYDDLASIFNDLEKKNVDGFVMATSYIKVLEEDSKASYDKLKLIYNFDIEIPKEESEETSVDIANEPFIVYLSGIDSRYGIQDTSLSDVNMLAVVNPKEAKILLVSVPRDYYVQLHGTTGNKDKLTHAGIYGIEMSKNTMADIFGVKIAHTIKVSFNTVQKLVDAVGGVDVNSDTTFTAWTDKGCYFTTGKLRLNGRCALAYARERMAYASGDRHRVQNQQEVLTAILKKATSVEHIVNYPKLLSAIEGTFQTSLSYNEITGFAKTQMNTLRSWSTESISVDGSGGMMPTYSMGSQKLYVMIPNQKTIDAAKKKINEYLK